MPILKTFPLILLLPTLASADTVFLEKDGIVAIEAESTSSRLGDWKKKTDVADFMGECHLEFTGNKPENGPPKSPLEYQFTIEKGGTYQLTLRARKRLETEREDISNDCYVSLEGDFEAAGGAPLKLLEEPTKMFGGNSDSWGWTRRLDANHKKHDPLYALKSGETYTLTIHGRSKNFNLDRILLVHKDVGLREAQKKNPREVRSGPSTSSSNFTPLTERRLTNREGRTILAKLLSKNTTTVTVLIDDRRHTLEISTLSDEDQEFLKEWSPEKP
ncbi:MAG: hypothetical protein AAGA58_09140 [Verrucomicrobiota bacterium]